MMPTQHSVSIPPLVRVKSGALQRIGKYMQRERMSNIAVFSSHGLPEEIPDCLLDSLQQHERNLVCREEICEGSFEHACLMFQRLPRNTDAIVGLGGGKAIDVAKYIAFLAGLPFISVPTSLSNDGFSSPQSSLTVDGKRRSLASKLPYGVLVDLDVCQQAPEILWLSGVGDLVSKLTAVVDWKLAYHHNKTAVNDFAALLSDATVMQFIANPTRAVTGLRTFAMALLLNGVAMELAGSSRPASGSEHLISHGLDSISQRPRLHGLQVGLATYCVSRLQGGQQTQRIHELFQSTGFWEAIRADPFDKDEFLQALRIAPKLKGDFHTVLNECDALLHVTQWIEEDPHLQGCFC